MITVHGRVQLTKVCCTYIMNFKVKIKATYKDRCGSVLLELKMSSVRMLKNFSYLTRSIAIKNNNFQDFNLISKGF